MPDVCRTLAINLFAYLRRLTELRSKTIYNLENYEKVVWLSDIPREPECYTFLMGEGEIDEDWIRIKKPHMTPPPRPPKEFEGWVREEELENFSEIPELPNRNSSSDSTENTDGDDQRTNLMRNETPASVESADSERLSEIWDEYLEGRWLPWATDCERLDKIQKIYTQLHSIYQQEKRLGESYELILSLGLLTWKTSTGQDIRRHLITAQASIELNGKTGSIHILPGPEGAKLSLEQDMLEVSDQPDPDKQRAIQQEIKDMGDDISSTISVKEILSTWVHATSAEGSYSEELKAPASDSFPLSPEITYAPAVILRKRSERDLISACNKIIKQLEEGVIIPTGVRRLVEIIEESHDTDSDHDESDKTSEFEDVLLPMPSNDKQRRIVERLRVSSGVLVQGPPGTGKSHTIANLICHLLASGNRVLVTSQTPRALEVLKSMIPEEISGLCVSLLGKDTTAFNGLEGSVHKITDQQQSWDRVQNENKIKRSERKLDELKRKDSELCRKLREIRERETYKHRICDGAYSGSAQRIAEKIRLEQSIHGWLDVCAEENTPPPLTNEEALELLGLMRQLTPDVISRAEKALPSLDELPTPEGFLDACQSKSGAKAQLSDFEDILGSATFGRLGMANEEKLACLRKAIDEFLYTRTNILKSKQPWVASAVEDLVSGNDRKWSELLQLSQKLLGGLMEKAKQSERLHVDSIESYDRRVVMTHAKSLLEHLEGGGHLGFLFFRRKPVRVALYLIKKVRVNGELCRRPEIIRQLLAILELEETIEELWGYWSELTDRIAGSRLMQVAALEDLCKSLEEVVKLHPLMTNAQKAVAAIENLSQPAWHMVNEVESYLRAVAAAESGIKLRETQKRLSKVALFLQNWLLKESNFQELQDLYRAVSAENVESYADAYRKVEKITEDRRLIARKDYLYQTLSQSAPTVAKNIMSEPHLPDWDEQLSCFVDSWRWAQAYTWLNRYIAGLSESEIMSELEKTEDQICDTTASLASALAWGYCIDRLKESERMHLEAWALEIKKLGKRKGKRVQLHLKAAQENMEHCRSAIPAWIMPLYRVIESVKPGVDLYDVAIIDEASQSGVEAILLLYLAKKVIVVGDDQQISPEDIGVPQADVDSLMAQYLRDLPLPPKTALGIRSSFFELGRILFGDKIILTEHFRCMPEIIQFSNDLCYANTPLEPLRQYPPNRLEPILTYHVKDGYREGTANMARNRPEAQCVAEKIAECCKDPRYEGKTMGVISLLGEHQAQLIEMMLLDKIGPEEIERRNLVCGNAYAFQGGERDIMFLSMVAAPGETAMHAINSGNDKRRFNVAASRAKDQMWLFHTPTINDFRNKDCFRYRLLSYCQNPKRQPVSLEEIGIDIEQLRRDADTVKNKEKIDAPRPFGSWFEVDVFLRIVSKGYRAVPQFEVAGYFIDIVVEGMKSRLAVECDGDKYHSELDRIERDGIRERILRRSGWTFWRVRGSEFYRDPERAMESLWLELQRLGIATGGKDIVSNVGTPRTNGQPVPKKQMDAFRETAIQASENGESEDDETQPTLNSGRVFDDKNDPRRRSSTDLRNAIVSVLRKCPNRSCTKKSMTSRVCHHLKYITRGAPRVKFERRVMLVLRDFEDRGIIEEYKAKNIRIRLLDEDLAPSLF